MKLSGWPKILVPAALGQALGIFAKGMIDPVPLAWAMAFTVAFLIYVVLLNDWGDREVDRIRRKLFPQGCSPKTIPDRILAAEAVLAAGLVAGLGALAVAWLGARVCTRPWFTPGAFVALSLFQAYTFRPLKLNYRGGGEFAETLGTGLLMPWLHAYMQSGLAWHPTYWFLAGFVALGLASSLASGLSDEESDMVGGKRTFTTMWGNRRVRACVEGLLAVSALIWLATAYLLHSHLPWPFVLAPAGILLYQTVCVCSVSARATTRAFAEHRLYKQHLHRGIWYSASVFAFILMGMGLSS